jgi:hypothetical protein
VLKEYGKTGLADIVVTPSEDIPDFRVDPDMLSFAHEVSPESDRLRPWHASPVSLKGVLQDSHGKDRAVKLVPLGCTTLRRTTFMPAGEV